MAGLADFNPTMTRDQLMQMQYANANPLLKSYMYAKERGILGGYRASGLRGNDVSPEQLSLQQAVSAALTPTAVTDYRDVHGLSDALSYTGNALGQTAYSVAPMMAAGLASPLLGAKTAVGKFLAGQATMAPIGGLMAYNNTVNTYTEDPTLSQLSPERILEAARNTALVSGALEAAAPALVSRGQPGVLKTAGTEAFTEATQSTAEQAIQMNDDPTRAFDQHEVINSALSGAIGGGAMGVMDGSTPTATELKQAGTEPVTDVWRLTTDAGAQVADRILGREPTVDEKSGGTTEANPQKGTPVFSSISERIQRDKDSRDTLVGATLYGFKGAANFTKDFAKGTVDRVDTAISESHGVYDTVAALTRGSAFANARQLMNGDDGVVPKFASEAEYQRYFDQKDQASVANMQDALSAIINDRDASENDRTAAQNHLNTLQQESTIRAARSVAPFVYGYTARGVVRHGVNVAKKVLERAEADLTNAVNLTGYGRDRDRKVRPVRAQTTKFNLQDAHLPKELYADTFQVLNKHMEPTVLQGLAAATDGGKVGMNMVMNALFSTYMNSRYDRRGDLVSDQKANPQTVGRMAATITSSPKLLGFNNPTFREADVRLFKAFSSVLGPLTNGAPDGGANTQDPTAYDDQLTRIGNDLIAVFDKVWEGDKATGVKTARQQVEAAFATLAQATTPASYDMGPGSFWKTFLNPALKHYSEKDIVHAINVASVYRASEPFALELYSKEEIGAAGQVLLAAFPNAHVANNVADYYGAQVAEIASAKGDAQMVQDLAGKAYVSPGDAVDDPEAELSSDAQSTADGGEADSFGDNAPLAEDALSSNDQLSEARPEFVENIKHTESNRGNARYFHRTDDAEAMKAREAKFAADGQADDYTFVSLAEQLQRGRDPDQASKQGFAEQTYVRGRALLRNVLHDVDASLAHTRNNDLESLQQRLKQQGTAGTKDTETLRRRIETIQRKLKNDPTQVRYYARKDTITTLERQRKTLNDALEHHNLLRTAYTSIDAKNLQAHLERSGAQLAKLNTQDARVQALHSNYRRMAAFVKTNRVKLDKAARDQLVQDLKSMAVPAKANAQQGRLLDDPDYQAAVQQLASAPNLKVAREAIAALSHLESQYLDYQFDDVSGAITASLQAAAGITDVIDPAQTDTGVYEAGSTVAPLLDVLSQYGYYERSTADRVRSLSDMDGLKWQAVSNTASAAEKEMSAASKIVLTMTDKNGKATVFNVDSLKLVAKVGKDYEKISGKEVYNQKDINLLRFELAISDLMSLPDVTGIAFPNGRIALSKLGRGVYVYDTTFMTALVVSELAARKKAAAATDAGKARRAAKQDRFKALIEARKLAAANQIPGDFSPKATDAYEAFATLSPSATTDAEVIDAIFRQFLHDVPYSNEVVYLLGRDKQFTVVATGEKTAGNDGTFTQEFDLRTELSATSQELEGGQETEVELAERLARAYQDIATLWEDRIHFVEHELPAIMQQKKKKLSDTAKNAILATMQAQRDMLLRRADTTLESARPARSYEQENLIGLAMGTPFYGLLPSRGVDGAPAPLTTEAAYASLNATLTQLAQTVNQREANAQASIAHTRNTLLALREALHTLQSRFMGEDAAAKRYAQTYNPKTATYDTNLNSTTVGLHSLRRLLPNQTVDTYGQLVDTAYTLGFEVFVHEVRKLDPAAAVTAEKTLTLMTGTGAQAIATKLVYMEHQIERLQAVYDSTQAYYGQPNAASKLAYDQYVKTYTGAPEDRLPYSRYQEAYNNAGLYNVLEDFTKTFAGKDKLTPKQRKAMRERIDSLLPQVNDPAVRSWFYLLNDVRNALLVADTAASPSTAATLTLKDHAMRFADALVAYDGTEMRVALNLFRQANNGDKADLKAFSLAVMDYINERASLAADPETAALVAENQHEFYTAGRYKSVPESSVKYLEFARQTGMTLREGKHRERYTSEQISAASRMIRDEIKNFDGAALRAAEANAHPLDMRQNVPFFYQGMVFHSIEHAYYAHEYGELNPLRYFTYDPVSQRTVRPLPKDNDKVRTARINTLAAIIAASAKTDNERALSIMNQLHTTSMLSNTAIDSSAYAEAMRLAGDKVAKTYIFSHLFTTHQPYAAEVIPLKALMGTHVRETASVTSAALEAAKTYQQPAIAVDVDSLTATFADDESVTDFVKTVEIQLRTLAGRSKLKEFANPVNVLQLNGALDDRAVAVALAATLAGFKVSVDGVNSVDRFDFSARVADLAVTLATAGLDEKLADFDAQREQYRMAEAGAAHDRYTQQAPVVAEVAKFFQSEGGTTFSPEALITRLQASNANTVFFAMDESERLTYAKRAYEVVHTYLTDTYPAGYFGGLFSLPKPSDKMTPQRALTLLSTMMLSTDPRAVAAQLQIRKTLDQSLKSIKDEILVQRREQGRLMETSLKALMASRDRLKQLQAGDTIDAGELYELDDLVARLIRHLNAQNELSPALKAISTELERLNDPVHAINVALGNDELRAQIIETYNVAASNAYHKYYTYLASISKQAAENFAGRFDTAEGRSVDRPLQGSLFAQNGVVVVPVSRTSAVTSRYATEAAELNRINPSAHTSFATSPKSTGVITLETFVSDKDKTIAGENYTRFVEELSKLSAYAQAHPDVSIYVPLMTAADGAVGANVKALFAHLAASAPNIFLVEHTTDPNVKALKRAYKAKPSRNESAAGFAKTLQSTQTSVVRGSALQRKREGGFKSSSDQSRKRFKKQTRARKNPERTEASSGRDAALEQIRTALDLLDGLSTQSAAPAVKSALTATIQVGTPQPTPKGVLGAAKQAFDDALESMAVDTFTRDDLNELGSLLMAVIDTQDRRVYSKATAAWIHAARKKLTAMSIYVMGLEADPMAIIPPYQPQGDQRARAASRRMGEDVGVPTEAIDALLDAGTILDSNDAANVTALQRALVIRNVMDTLQRKIPLLEAAHTDAIAKQKVLLIDLTKKADGDVSEASMKRMTAALEKLSELERAQAEDIRPGGAIYRYRQRLALLQGRVDVLEAQVASSPLYQTRERPRTARRSYAQEAYVQRQEKAAPQAAATSSDSKKTQKQTPPPDTAGTPHSPEYIREVADDIRRMRGEAVLVEFSKALGVPSSHTAFENGTRLINVALHSLNPRSQAAHEAMHDLIYVLRNDPRYARVLSQLLMAASQPHTVARLRSLLAEHPQALRQIETDMDERLAYTFQFYTEGLLNLSPQSQGVFRRIFDAIRRVLGIIPLEERLVLMMDALQRGELAEPSAIHDVATRHRLMGDGTGLAAAVKPIRWAADRLFRIAVDQLHEFEIPALSEIADRFRVTVEREDLNDDMGFLQDRARQYGYYMNDLANLMENTTKEQRKALVRAIQSGNYGDDLTSKQIRALFENMHRYMRDAGVKVWDDQANDYVPVKYQRNYFPRVWDKDKIAANFTKFSELVAKEGHMSLQEAQSVVSAMTSGDGMVELAESEADIGFTPMMFGVNRRKFTFITEQNAAAFVEFQSDDMAHILSTYIRQAVHRSEYARYFGDRGQWLNTKMAEAELQGASPEDIARARTVIRGLEGTLGWDINPNLNKMMSAIVTLQNLIILPLALLSSLVDPLGIAVRTGDLDSAWMAFKAGIQGILYETGLSKEDKDARMMEIGTLLGVVENQNLIDAMGYTFSSVQMGSTLRNINEKFFRVIGMSTWNQRMRASAALAGARYIYQHRDDVERLAELGLRPSDIHPNADDTHYQIHLMGGPLSAESEERLRIALYKWTDSVVIRPDAGLRPTWMSDPRWMLVAHLKTFTFAFQNVIMRRVAHMGNKGDYVPLAILLAYVPAQLVINLTRGLINGTIWNTNTTSMALIGRAIETSGITGVASFGLNASKDYHYGGYFGSSFLGPSFEHAMALLRAAFGDGSAREALVRSLPFGTAIRGYI